MVGFVSKDIMGRDIERFISTGVSAVRFDTSLTVRALLSH
jgi:hypothetical protein